MAGWPLAHWLSGIVVFKAIGSLSVCLSFRLFDCSFMSVLFVCLCIFCLLCVCFFYLSTCLSVCVPAKSPNSESFTRFLHLNIAEKIKRFSSPKHQGLQHSFHFIVSRCLLYYLLLSISIFEELGICSLKSQDLCWNEKKERHFLLI